MHAHRTPCCDVEGTVRAGGRGATAAGLLAVVAVEGALRDGASPLAPGYPPGRS